MDFLRDAIAVLGLVCWQICFWWMHRISSRQNTVLEQLRSQTHRIESVSKEEHDILKELNPVVQKIEETVSKDSP